MVLYLADFLRDETIDIGHTGEIYDCKMVLGQKSLQKFRWFFCRFEDPQKDISKLTDL